MNTTWKENSMTKSYQVLEKIQLLHILIHRLCPICKELNLLLTMTNVWLSCHVIICLQLLQDNLKQNWNSLCQAEYTNQRSINLIDQLASSTFMQQVIRRKDTWLMVPFLYFSPFILYFCYSDSWSFIFFVVLLVTVVATVFVVFAPKVTRRYLIVKALL